MKPYQIESKNKAHWQAHYGETMTYFEYLVWWHECELHADIIDAKREINLTRDRVKSVYRQLIHFDIRDAVS